MTRVLICDDHSIVRDGLKRILAATEDLQVVDEAASGDAALALVKKNDYDVAMLDMSMPGLSGLDLIKRVRLEKPKLRILVLSMHGEHQYAARALKAVSIPVTTERRPNLPHSIDEVGLVKGGRFLAERFGVAASV